MDEETTRSTKESASNEEEENEGGEEEGRNGDASIKKSTSSCHRLIAKGENRMACTQADVRVKGHKLPHRIVGAYVL